MFIPDISGFTEFVTQTAIEHSQHIIEELLEVIIDANEIGLSLSEIEGDAVLFYRESAAPDTSEILGQVRRMYMDFHKHLKLYETQRICQCGACSTASKLTLKFFIHYGEVTTKHVKEHDKLFGTDVIIVHRLMKNHVHGTEYALLTDSLTEQCEAWGNDGHPDWGTAVPGEEIYDTGKVSFCHIDLEPLKKLVPEPVPADYSIPEATENLFSGEQIVEAPIELVFDVISDMSFRHHWLEGLKGSDRLNHKIAQPGSSHRCVIKNTEGDPTFVAHDYRIDKDVITFVESDHKQKISSVFTLRRIDGGITKVEQRNFWKPHSVKRLVFDLFMRRKMESTLAKSLENLGAYCRTLAESGEVHEYRIELGLEV